MACMDLIIVVNDDYFFLSHRVGIALEAKNQGYGVTIIAKNNGLSNQIISYGFNYVPLQFTRQSKNIINEIMVLLKLYLIYRKHRPTIVHHVTMQPIIYGSIAALLNKNIKIINAVSGLGYMFINEKERGIAHKVVSTAFRIFGNKRQIKYIFQNNDDVEVFKNNSWLVEGQYKLIRGSGVDLLTYKYCPEINTDTLRIILSARMLWDKGVGEYVESAKIIKKKYANKVEFVLMGAIDTINPRGIEEKTIAAWHSDGIVNYIGFQNNVKEWLERSNIVVLPSYREGVPKALIEACAIGRAIVTTDVPGCREVVKDNYNGLLVPAKNVDDLVKAIVKLIENPILRYEMGKNGRILAESEFSIEKVINDTLDYYDEITRIK